MMEPEEIALLLSENISGAMGLVTEAGYKPAIIKMKRGTVIQADHFDGPFRGRGGKPFYMVGIEPNIQSRFLKDWVWLAESSQGREFVDYKRVLKKHMMKLPDYEASDDLPDEDIWGSYDPTTIVVTYKFKKILTINPDNVESIKLLGD